MAFDSVFPLSQDWEVLPLGEVCKRGGGNVQTGPFGSQLHASDYVAEGIPTVMPQNIGDNRILDTGIARITEADAQRLSKYRIREGDIIYSRRGDVERRALVRKAEDGWLCGTGCLRIRFGEEVVYPRYAAHYLGHPAVREWIVRHAHGATMPNLNTTILSELPFVLPPWTDQVSIGDAIELYDQKIDLNRRINKTLEAMAQAIFKSWFVDFDPVKAKIAAIEQGEDPLRAAMRAISGKTDAELDQMPREHHDQLATTAALFPDAMEESELGEIPKGWEAGKLEDLLVLQRGFDLPSASREPGPYPIIAASGPAGTHGMPMAKGPGVVTGRSGVLGKVFLELNDFWPLNTTLWVKELRAATPCYAYEALKLLDFASFNAGSAVPTLNRNHIHSLPHLVPDKGCVAAYEAFAIVLHRQVRSNQEQSEILTRTRDALLPKLLSGELSVLSLKDRATA